MNTAADEVRDEDLPWPFCSVRGRLALLGAGGVCGIGLALFVPVALTGALGIGMLAIVHFGRVAAKRAARRRAREESCPQWDALSPEELVWWGRCLKRNIQLIERWTMVTAALFAVTQWLMGATVTWTIHYAVSSGNLWVALFLVPCMVSMTIGIVYGILGTESRVRRPPLCYTARLMEWVLPTRAYERCVQPFLADHQAEYFAALSRGQNRRACWLLVVCYAGLVGQLLLLGTRDLVRLLDPRGPE